MGYEERESGLGSGLSILLLAVAAVFALIAVCLVGQYVSYTNRAVVLENQFKATHQKVQGKFDNVWRIVEGKAHVSEKYKDGVLALVQAQVKGREGGSFMKSIQETLPGLDASMYRDVSNAIEAQRTEFLNLETELAAVKQEHDNLRMQMPSSLFVGGRPELKFSFVTSERTERAFTTGHDESSSDPFSK